MSLDLDTLYPPIEIKLDGKTYQVELNTSLTDRLADLQDGLPESEEEAAKMSTETLAKFAAIYLGVGVDNYEEFVQTDMRKIVKLVTHLSGEIKKASENEVPKK